MSSVLRPVRKRKKGRTLGRVDILRREDYAALELDPKVELIRSLVPLGLTRRLRNRGRSSRTVARWSSRSFRKRPSPTASITDGVVELMSRRRGALVSLDRSTNERFASSSRLAVGFGRDEKDLDELGCAPHWVTRASDCDPIRQRFVHE